MSVSKSETYRRMNVVNLSQGNDKALYSYISVLKCIHQLIYSYVLIKLRSYRGDTLIHNIYVDPKCCSHVQ